MESLLSVNCEKENIREISDCITFPYISEGGGMARLKRVTNVEG